MTPSLLSTELYVYDIFGPTVNLASRPEHISDPMEVTFCEDMYPLISEDFRFEDQGKVEIRGVGTKRIYRLIGEGREPVKPSDRRRTLSIPE